MKTIQVRPVLEQCWSSRYPQVICYIEDMISKFLPDAENTLYEILKDQLNEELINELKLSLQEKQNEPESTKDSIFNNY